MRDWLNDPLGLAQKSATAKKPKYEWPNCAAPGDGEFSSVFSDGHTQYKKAEVEPGRWQWVIDEDAMRLSREYEQRRNDLWWALRSRVLTDDEMEQVRRYGSSLNTPSGVSYRAEEKARELNDALYNQARLRLLYVRLEAGEDSTAIPEAR